MASEQQASEIRPLLLVEDSDSDADMISEILSQGGDIRFALTRVSTLSAAIETIGQQGFDVIVLDLSLPDCQGADSVRHLHELARNVPIVILTALEDEALASECVVAGAQDYLEKKDLRARTLRRAIGYALGRTQEARLRDMQATIDGFRRISSETQTTSITALLAGEGPLLQRSVREFDKLVAQYEGFVAPLAMDDAMQVGPARRELQHLATRLGDLNAGPRDVLDIHMEALNRAAAGRQGVHSTQAVFESRLLALQLMGLLVDYYRVGNRHYDLAEAPS